MPLALGKRSRYPRVLSGGSKPALLRKLSIALQDGRAQKMVQPNILIRQVFQSGIPTSPSIRNGYLPCGDFKLGVYAQGGHLHTPA